MHVDAYRLAGALDLEDLGLEVDPSGRSRCWSGVDLVVHALSPEYLEILLERDEECEGDRGCGWPDGLGTGRGGRISPAPMTAND